MTLKGMIPQERVSKSDTIRDSTRRAILSTSLKLIDKYRVPVENFDPDTGKLFQYEFKYRFHESISIVAAIQEDDDQVVGKADPYLVIVKSRKMRDENGKKIIKDYYEFLPEGKVKKESHQSPNIPLRQRLRERIQEKTALRRVRKNLFDRVRSIEQNDSDVEFVLSDNQSEFNNEELHRLFHMLRVENEDGGMRGLTVSELEASQLLKILEYRDKQW